MEKKSYVLITPARNEEDYIEETIQSVISQTIRPIKWVIVNDGSTDRTEEIVKSYVNKFDFIQLITEASTGDRNFGSKVNAFKAGYNQLQDIYYNFIGNLDADVSFQNNYFESILKQFEINPKLGLAGGIIKELIKNRYVQQNISLNSVAGAVQLFRRKCFEDIGGFLPLKYGGEDAAAEIIARSNNWQVTTFPELNVMHHRRVSIGSGNILAIRFRYGITDYLLGYHPLFEIIRCLSLNRIMTRPYVTGTLSVLLGYFWSCIKKYEKQLPNDVVMFLRKEQINRLKKIFKF